MLYFLMRIELLIHCLAWPLIQKGKTSGVIEAQPFVFPSRSRRKL